MAYMLRLRLFMDDFLNRSVLHPGVLKVLIDLKCLQLLLLGEGDLPAYDPYYTLCL